LRVRRSLEIVSLVFIIVGILIVPYLVKLL